MPRLLALLLLSPLAAQATHAQEAKQGKGIDARTVAAYEKLGAVYGGMVKDEFRFLGDFREGKEAAEKGLPAFRFKLGPDGKLPPLPQVNVPFGLSFHDTKLTDEGLKEVAGLKNLSSLDLSGTKVTDAGLKHLAGLKNLSTLYLFDAKVTDEGLKELAGLTKLTDLELDGTQVTDAGMKHLAGLTNLSKLSLKRTKVTPAGARKLQQALPRCEITR